MIEGPLRKYMLLVLVEKADPEKPNLVTNILDVPVNQRVRLEHIKYIAFVWAMLSEEEYEIIWWTIALTGVLLNLMAIWHKELNDFVMKILRSMALAFIVARVKSENA
jgi:hypothetical protein